MGVVIYTVVTICLGRLKFSLQGLILGTYAYYGHAPSLLYNSCLLHNHYTVHDAEKDRHGTEAESSSSAMERAILTTKKIMAKLFDK